MLPEIPNANSSPTSLINSDIVSLTESTLFYQSELHGFISEDLNTNKALPILPINKTLPSLPEFSNKMRIKDYVFSVSTIFEETESTENLLRNSTSSPSGVGSSSSSISEDLSEIGCLINKNPYSYPNNNELIDAILDMMTEVERKNVYLQNQQSNNTNNSNLGEIIKSLNNSTDSLSSLLDEERIESLTDKNTSKTIFDTDLSLKSSDLRKVFYTRSNSPLSPSSSTENLLSNIPSGSGRKLQEDID